MLDLKTRITALLNGYIVVPRICVIIKYKLTIDRSFFAHCIGFFKHQVVITISAFNSHI